MSYCRFGPDSDVYLYPADHGIVCCACRLSKIVKKGFIEFYDNKVLHTLSEAIRHLGKHIAANHKVPDYAKERLMEEMKSSNPTD